MFMYENVYFKVKLIDKAIHVECLRVTLESNFSGLCTPRPLHTSCKVFLNPDLRFMASIAQPAARSISLAFIPNIFPDRQKTDFKHLKRGHLNFSVSPY